MNGFLVLGQCSMDNVPLGLFPARAEAGEFADRVPVDQIIAEASRVLGVDVSEPGVVGVAIVAFVNGVPQPMESVVDFEV